MPIYSQEHLCVCTCIPCEERALWAFQNLYLQKAVCLNTSNFLLMLFLLTLVLLTLFLLMLFSLLLLPRRKRTSNRKTRLISRLPLSYKTANTFILLNGSSRIECHWPSNKCPMFSTHCFPRPGRASLCYFSFRHLNCNFQFQDPERFNVTAMSVYRAMSTAFRRCIWLHPKPIFSSWVSQKF